MAYTKHIANRGKIKMLVEPGTNVNDPKAKCILDNPRTGKSKPQSIQVALKFGYWVAVPRPKVVLKAGD